MDSATNYYPFWENQELKRLVRDLWDKYQKQQEEIAELLILPCGNHG